MSKFLIKWAALGAVGVLGLAPVGAAAWNTANTTTRGVVILNEDTPCVNANDYGTDEALNRQCQAVGYPEACCTNASAASLCTGSGTSVGGSAPCCTAPGVGATCTIAGAGTCDADNPVTPILPPDFAAAPATGSGPSNPPGRTTNDCFQSGSAGDYSDLTGALGGTADAYGILTNTGGTVWTLEIPASVYGRGLQDTLAKSGATLTSNTSVKLRIDTAGAGTPPTNGVSSANPSLAARSTCTAAGVPHACCTQAASNSSCLAGVGNGTGGPSACCTGAGTGTCTPLAAGTCTEYYSATLDYPALPGVSLLGVDSPFDRPIFGSAIDTTDLPFLSKALDGMCLGSGSPPFPGTSACCDQGFMDIPGSASCTGTDNVSSLTPVPALCCDAGAPGTGTCNAACAGPTVIGVPLTLSCYSMTADLASPAPYSSVAAFGPGVPTAVKGLLNSALCDPPGSSFGDPATTNFLFQPGVVGGEYVTSTVKVYTRALGSAATTPAFATQDYQVVEGPGDTDADLVPNNFDNCETISNGPAPAFNPDRSCDTDRDGYGNRCDCDFDNSGGGQPCSITDFNAFRTAFQDLTPPIDAGAGLEADSDCDGDVDVTDFNNFRSGFQSAAGTLDSGLACAGTTPCPIKN